MNRDKLNIYEPDKDHIWTGISDQYRKRKRKRGVVIGFSIAAAATLFILFTIPNQIKPDDCYQVALSDYGKEYRLMEVNYLKEIEQFETGISLENTNIEIAQELKYEITFLDSLFCKEQLDLSTAATEEIIIESLIKYYEAKLKMLSRLQMEIERSKIQKERELASPAI